MDHLLWVLVQIEDGSKDRQSCTDGNDHGGDDDDASSAVAAALFPPVRCRHRLVWWPCLVFRDYGPFHAYHAADLDAIKDEDARHDLLNRMTVRTMDNLLHGRSNNVRVARLLGRPLEDYVEVDVDVVAAATPSPLKSHLAMSHITQLEQMDPRAWFALPPSKTPGDGDGVNDDDTVQEGVYLSYMGGLDELHRIVLQAVAGQGSCCDPPPPETSGGFYRMGRDQLEIYRKGGGAAGAAAAGGGEEAAATSEEDRKDPEEERPAAAAAARRTDDDAVAEETDEDPKERQEGMEGTCAGAATAATASAAAAAASKSTSTVVSEEASETHEDPKKRREGTEDISGAAASSTSTVVSVEASTGGGGSEGGSRASSDGDETAPSPELSATHDEDPGIGPTDSFQEAWGKLQFVGWDRILWKDDDDDGDDDDDAPELYCKPRWLRHGDDGPAVRGRDCFDDAELAEYMKARYGWVGPATDPAEEGGNEEPEMDSAEAAADRRETVEGTKPPSHGGPETASRPGHETPERPKRGMKSITAGRKKQKTVETVVTPASTRQSSRQRKPVTFYGEDADEGRQPQSGTPAIKRKTMMELDEKDAFYHFVDLMDTLKKNGGWKYVRPNKNLGYSAGSVLRNNYAYEIPNARQERDGGEHLIDFFFTEQEVIDYCKGRQYYERRYELGLVGDEEDEDEDLAGDPNVAAFCTP